MKPLKVPKKVNRHVIKAIDFLQKSRTDFVHIKAIQDRVRRSLRYTKPVSNLEEVIKDSLRKQTELGIITRSGSSMYAITLAFQGLLSHRSVHKVIKKPAYKRTSDSLTAGEIASVRRMLRGVQRPSVKTKPGVRSTALCKRKPSRNLSVRPQKPAESIIPIICNNCAMNIENFNVPKKVNRHVFKALRYFTEKENYEFVPLDKIKMEVKWTMKNLNPLKDLESVIQLSLTNLSTMGVLSERLGSYRLNRLEALRPDSSLLIFGKVSDSFFRAAPIAKPMLKNAYDFLEDNHFGGQFSTLTSSMDPNIKPIEGIFGTAPSLGSVYAPLETSESLYVKGNETPLDEPMSEDSHVYQERQSSTYPEGESEHSPMVPLTMDFMASEEVFGGEPIENTSSTEFSGGHFHAPLMSPDSLSLEMQNADESQNISFMKGNEMLLDEPMSEQSSAVPINIDFRPSEGIFEREPNVRNASSTAHCGNPFSFQLPLFASENLSSQEMHNAHADCEMGLGRSSQDSNVSFLRAAQSFHESFLQSISNEPPNLFLQEADSETEGSL